MHDFEWLERAVSRLKGDLDNSQREFDEKMIELRRRNVEELAILKELTKIGILWA